MNTLQPYPWHQQVWETLRNNRHHLAHTLLLHGKAGIGKRHFAQIFSQFLLCEQANEYACGSCVSCRWFSEHTHPDFCLVSAEEQAIEEGESIRRKSHTITIAQIRELTDFIMLSSHQQGRRIVLLSLAEQLNHPSANALLKILEEPPLDVTFILLSHQAQVLLPTILSRCHKIAMPAPKLEQALIWANQEHSMDAEQLVYWGGSPLVSTPYSFAKIQECWALLAQGRSLSPHILAPLLIAQSAEIGALILQKWLYDLLCISVGSEPTFHHSQTKIFKKLASNLHLSALYSLCDNVNAWRKWANHPLNHELQAESLLWQYTHLFS